LIFRFEDFSLDCDWRELLRGSEIVAVEPQVFDVSYSFPSTAGKPVQ
jgi:hypothetical protein